MPDNLNIETTLATEHEDGKGQHGPSPSQVSAIVEAAYILEAVRK
jgi:hypothetical protein